MAIPTPICIRLKANQDLKDAVVGVDSDDVAADEIGIFIAATNNEKTQTANGVLRQCCAQLLSVLHEYRGATYLNVSRLIPDGGDNIINDVGTTVTGNRAAVIVGNLFGQDNVYSVGGAALLAEQSHNIDKSFKQLLAALNEQDKSTQ